MAFFSRPFLFAGLCISALAIIILSFQTSSAADLTLQWDTSSDARVVGYKLHYGTQSRVYSNSFDLGKSTIYTVTGLQAGVTYYFAVTAYDASRLESGFSNEVSRTITASCTSSISPTSRSFSSSGGSATVSVTAPQTCAWSSSSGVPWVTIRSPYSGVGNGTVELSVAANTGGSRAGGITIADKTFTVYQDAVPSLSTYTINASAGSGGTISPSGTVSVKAGASQTFTIRPDRTYRISSVTVDGRWVGAVSTYTFTNVNARHTIRATFRRR